MKKELETVEETSTIPKYCSKYPKLLKKKKKRKEEGLVAQMSLKRHDN